MADVVRSLPGCGFCGGRTTCLHETSDRELAELHKAGVRGVRMIAGERGVVPFSELETIASHIRDMGWHIEFLIWPEH